MSRINSVLRRRLSDRVEALCRTTCVLGDLETAVDLLAVLTKVQERGRRKFGGERRISDDPVSRMRSAIAASRRLSFVAGLQPQSSNDQFLRTRRS